MFWEKICSYSATNLGKALFPFLPRHFPEHFFNDKVFVICSPQMMAFVSHITFDYKLNIQQSFWWSLYTILPKQTHLTSDRLALVPTRSKIQYSLDNLIFDSIFAWLLAGRWLSFSWTRHYNIFSLAGQCFTILWPQSGIQALQVLNPDKQWVNATPPSG